MYYNCDAVGVVLAGTPDTVNRVGEDQGYDHLKELNMWSMLVPSNRLELEQLEEVSFVGVATSELLAALSAPDGGFKGDIVGAIALGVAGITSDERYTPGGTKKHVGRVLVITDAVGAVDAMFIREEVATQAKDNNVQIDVIGVDAKNSTPEFMAVLRGMAATTGGRVTTTDEPLDMLQMLASCGRVSHAKPGADLTLAGVSLAHVSLYPYIMPAKPTPMTKTSTHAVRAKEEGARPDATPAGEVEGGGSGAGDGAPYGGGAVQGYWLQGTFHLTNHLTGGTRYRHRRGGYGGGGGDEEGGGGGNGDGGGGDGRAGAGTSGQAGLQKVTQFVRERSDEERAAREVVDGEEGVGYAADEDLTVPPERIVKAFAYGPDLIAVPDAVEREFMKIPAGAGAELEVLSFVPAARVPRYAYMGVPAILVPQQPSGKVKGTSREDGQVRLTALVTAMREAGMGAIIRHRYHRSTGHTLYFAIPAASGAGASLGKLGAGGPVTKGAAGGEEEQDPEVVSAVEDVGTSLSAPLALGPGARAIVAMRPGELTGAAYEHPSTQAPITVADIPSLLLVPLPWDEDLRSCYTFVPPFTVAGAGAAAGAAAAAADDAPALAAADALIDAMDLTVLPAYGPAGFRPERSFNPRFNAVARSILAREADPSAPALGADPMVLAYIDHTAVAAAGGEALQAAGEALKSACGLRGVQGSKLVTEAQEGEAAAVVLLATAQRARKRRAEDVAEEAPGAGAGAVAEGEKGGKEGGEWEGEGEPSEDPSAPSLRAPSQGDRKRARLDEGSAFAEGAARLGGSPAPSASAAVRITTGTPVEDFKRALAKAEEAGPSGAGRHPAGAPINELSAVLLQLADDAEELYVEKVLACLRALRAACVKYGFSPELNRLLGKLKTSHGPCDEDKEGRHVWRRIVDEQMSLITNEESAISAKTAEEAAAFLTE